MVGVRGGGERHSGLRWSGAGAGCALARRTRQMGAERGTVRAHRERAGQQIGVHRCHLHHIGNRTRLWRVLGALETVRFRARRVDSVFGPAGKPHPPQCPGRIRTREMNTNMATDYDAPRRTDDSDLGEDSLEELKARRTEAQSGSVDVDEAEVAEGFELPGAD